MEELGFPKITFPIARRIVPDGNYFSPDFGEFTVKDNIGYTDIAKFRMDDSVIRHLPCISTVDYSTLTDEERDRNHAEFLKQQQEQIAREKKVRERIQAVVESVKAKLTKDEWNAILAWREVTT